MGKKRKGGRKSLYESKVQPHLKTIKLLRSRGVTNTEICKELGIARKTFYRYIEEHKELAEAVKEGKREIDLKMFNALIEKGLAGDSAILIFYAKTQLGFIEESRKQEIEIKKKEKESEKEAETIKIDLEIK